MGHWPPQFVLKLYFSILKLSKSVNKIKHLTKQFCYTHLFTHTHIHSSTHPPRNTNKSITSLQSEVQPCLIITPFILFDYIYSSYVNQVHYLHKQAQNLITTTNTNPLSLIIILYILFDKRKNILSNLHF